MAIARVDYPATLEAQADFAKHSALIETRFLDATAIAREVVGGNIAQGTVFQIGGVVYQATSDTAITGTASDYVKITPDGATATASYVLNLSGVDWSKQYNGYYDASDNLYIFDEGKALAAGEIAAVFGKYLTQTGDGDAYVKRDLTIGQDVDAARDLKVGRNADITGFVTCANFTNVSGTYAVGDTGPAGGIIFYDAGNWTGVHGGWRYLEALPYDAIGTETSGREWGGASTEVGLIDHDAIGAGKANTAKIVSVLGGVEPDNSLSNYAAAICYGLSYGGYSDWFLPSKDELNQLYLQRNNLDNFASDFYWSSSEGSANGAWTQVFSVGNQGNNLKVNSYRVRAVRRF